MTHSLHRKGNYSSLKRDYVILAMLAAGVNDKNPDSRKKMLRIAEILKSHNPVNILTEKAWKISSVIQGVFTDINVVKQVLLDFKKEDLGISIVVSGLISEIEILATDIDLNLHTVHLSLGTFGKTELLPLDRIMQITTMCGHHCISPQSALHYVDLVKKNKITVEKAAKKLSKPCVCGIFNTSRAIELLREMSLENM